MDAVPELSYDYFQDSDQELEACYLVDRVGDRSAVGTVWLLGTARRWCRTDPFHKPAALLRHPGHISTDPTHSHRRF